MIKYLSIFTFFITMYFTALGQTAPKMPNPAKKVYKVKQGKNVFIQHITDAPGEVRKLKILDLNDSIITLAQDRHTALIFPVSDINGFWIVDGKTKAKMFAKSTVGLAWFIVGLTLFLVVLDYDEPYFRPHFLNQTVHVMAASGGIYMIVKSNAKANATKVDLLRDQIIFKRHAR